MKWILFSLYLVSIYHRALYAGQIVLRSVPCHSFQDELNDKLKSAVIANQASKTQTLIRDGAHITIKIKEKYPLIFFANACITQILLDAGAGVDERTPACDDKVPTSMTALIYTALEEKELLKKMKLLIQRGANINAQDGNGFTAIMTALFNKKARVVRLLASEGADLSLHNSVQNKTFFDYLQEPEYQPYESVVKVGVDTYKKQTTFSITKALGHVTVLGNIVRDYLFD